MIGVTLILAPAAIGIGLLMGVYIAPAVIRSFMNILENL